MTLSEAEITDLIRKILNLSYLPLTGADIRDFIKESPTVNELNEHTYKVVLKRLSDNGIIKREKIQGRKYVFFSTIDRPKRSGTIELILIGKKITFSSSIKPSLEGEDEVDIIKEDLLQCVGLIDYFEIRKFCGIHQYAPGKAEKGRVQRAMKVDWVDELRGLLQAANTTMMTTAIVYLDENDPIELEEITSMGEYKIFKLTIPYGGTTYDEDKIGWILDGQQRMWASEFIAISKQLRDEPYIPIIAPISVAIGNFQDDNESQLKKRMELIRKIFIVSNETRPIPDMWKKSIISHMDTDNIYAMSKKLSKYSTYERLARQLQGEEDSPFQYYIDLKDLQKKRSNSNLITLGNMTECIKYIAEQGFISDGYYPEDSVEFKQNLAKIKDYFNTIKVIWKDSWEMEYPDTVIRTTTILFMFALFTSEFTTLYQLKKLRKNLIKVDFIPTLMMIKEFTKFRGDDPSVRDLGYGKKNARAFLKEIQSFCMDFMEEIDEEEVERILHKVISLYSPGSPSHF